MAASPEGGDVSASKRQKTLIHQDAAAATAETVDSTTHAGLAFLDQLKSTVDKTRRTIADEFLELPDRNDFPDYYQAIRLPISIGTIEAKLRKNGYPTLTTVESDLKRMIANAKLYNDDKSIIYADAERIRKTVSNWMTKHNPAYKNPDYVAFPTPLPAVTATTDDNGDGNEDGTNEVKPTSEPPKREPSDVPRKPTVTLSLKGPRDRKVSVAASSPADSEKVETSGDFVGKSFSQAQEQIINELINYVEDGVQIFHPFVNLPPRSLTDYYHVIKKPTSLFALRKRTRGQHGREAATGVSDMKSWDAFEEESSYVWKNAREYNEDGSDMFNLAGEFEQHFKKRLGLAKEQVEEPQQPKIRLGAARGKPVLHLGGSGGSGGSSGKTPPARASTPGVSVDKEALARQKQAVQAGASDQQTPAQTQRPTSVLPSRSASQVPTLAATERAQSTHAASPPKPSALKAETSVAPSPSLAKARPHTNTVAETQQAPQPATSMPPPAAAVHTPYQTPNYIAPPATFVDTFARTKPVADALLSNLTVTTHPQLNLAKPLRLDIPPSRNFTQQSLTLLLPPTHYYLQISPTVAPHILAGRQYKLFVTVNGSRLMALQQLAGIANGSETVNGVGGAHGGKKQVYEVALVQGVNRIEVEIAAMTGRAGVGGVGGGLEVEKVNVFVDLLRYG